MIGKGQIQDDKSYVYTCLQCQGSGWFHGDPCTHCYGGDIDRLLVEFAVARGERYYALLKRILAANGKAIYDAACEIRQKNGGFRPYDIAWLCIKFDWPQNRMKALAEWLEETHFMPAAMYSHLQEHGMKVSDMFDMAREKYGVEVVRD